MTRWKQFEQEAFEFLKTEFSDLHFKLKRQSDVSESNIEVCTDQKFLFRMVAKHSTALVEQIMLLQEDDKFVFSQKNNTREEESRQTFIKYLNSNFNHYSAVQTQSITINLDEKIIFSFIKQHYKQNNVSWIIASKKHYDLKISDLCLVPIKDIDKYFKATVVLRRNSCGPRKISGIKLNKAKEEILKICKNPKIEKIEGKYYLYGKINKGLLVQNDMKESRYGLTLSKEIFLSKKDTDKYEIKLMGQTTNPTIIFHLNPIRHKMTYPFQKDDFLNFANTKIN